jgi:hypothetical protein
MNTVNIDLLINVFTAAIDGNRCNYRAFPLIQRAAKMRYIAQENRVTSCFKTSCNSLTEGEKIFKNLVVKAAGLS